MSSPQIERVAIESLKHDPANARKHDARNLKAITESLQRFGQQKPIVVGAGDIVIAGNGQLAAATELGWTHINIVRTTLTGAEATAYAIADNRTAEFASWDDAVLLQSLQELDADMQAAAGFTADEIASMVFTDTVGPADDKFTHQLEKYEARVLKNIVLIYSFEQYERVYDAMAEYADKHGLSDNSEVVAHLLEANGHAVALRS